MRQLDTIVLQHELKRSQIALDKCTDSKCETQYKNYIRELASELLQRYREMKLM